LIGFTPMRGADTHRPSASEKTRHATCSCRAVVGGNDDDSDTGTGTGTHTDTYIMY
jgi:hypothetical protein